MRALFYSRNSYKLFGSWVMCVSRSTNCTLHFLPIQVAPRTALLSSCEGGLRKCNSVANHCFVFMYMYMYVCMCTFVCIILNKQFSVILGGLKQRKINNLREEDNLQREDKRPIPKVSFVRRFNCITRPV